MGLFSRPTEEAEARVPDVTVQRKSAAASIVPLGPYALTKGANVLVSAPDGGTETWEFHDAVPDDPTLAIVVRQKSGRIVAHRIVAVPDLVKLNHLEPAVDMRTQDIEGLKDALDNYAFVFAKRRNAPEKDSVLARARSSQEREGLTRQLRSAISTYPAERQRAVTAMLMEELHAYHDALLQQAGFDVKTVRNSWDKIASEALFQSIAHGELRVQWEKTVAHDRVMKAMDFARGGSASSTESVLS